MDTLFWDQQITDFKHLWKNIHTMTLFIIASYLNCLGNKINGKPREFKLMFKTDWTPFLLVPQQLGKTGEMCPYFRAVFPV